MKLYNSAKRTLLAVGNRNISSSTVRCDAWLSKVFVRNIEPTKESHSRMLSDKEIIFSLETHNFKPGYRKPYLATIQNRLSFLKSESSLGDCVHLVGSWCVSAGGDQDQALHLWKFTGGFEQIDNYQRLIRDNKDYERIMNEQAALVRSRHQQYLLAFSYWPAIESREPSNIYELRSYVLKPGTMIEWGNNWARAINFRQSDNEAFGGFFSQIGCLYNVHHLWCYRDHARRKETRENAWRVPGWDQCVAYTVPLIQDMQSRVLEPNPISPTQ